MTSRSSGWRRLRALIGLVAAAAGAALYLRTVQPAAPAARPAAARALPASYHRGPEERRAGAGAPSPCEACHGSAPHRLRRGNRAFLNLHVARMTCAVCHAGGGLALRRPAAGARVAAGRAAGPAWTEEVWPSDLRPRGPSCSECHRRGSPILRSGLYDAYRQRILEELALLYRLQRGSP